MSFYMEHNRALDAIRAGKTAFGLQLRSRSPLIAELAGYLGFDYVYFETEHYACNDETVENLVRACQVSGVTPMIRVICDDPEYIGHLYDTGVQGVILPHVETAEQAKRFVDAAKFPPLGHRGASSASRAACLGCMDGKKFLEASNRNCSAIAMIETVQGAQNLDSILEAGIDMIRIGYSDLTLDMGIPGTSPRDARVEALTRHIVETAKAYNVPVGGKCSSPEDAEYFISMGFSWLNAASDLDHLKKTLAVRLDQLRAVAEK